MADAVARENSYLISIDLDGELKLMFSTPSSENHVVPQDRTPALKMNVIPNAKLPNIDVCTRTCTDYDMFM